MGIRDKVFRRRRTKAVGDVITSPFVQDTLRLIDGSLLGYGSTYRKITPVRTVVDQVADWVSDTPLKIHLRSDQGRPEVRDHPAALSLQRPNPGLTPKRLVFGWVADLMVYGNNYTRMVPQPDGTVWLVPLPPFRVTPLGGALMAPSHFALYPPGGGPIDLSASEVLHMHLFDPEDRRIGSSKLDALRNILLEEVEASKNRRGYWANGARVEGWIEMPAEIANSRVDPLSDAALVRLRESVQNTHAGGDNAGKVGILEGGGHFNPAGWSPKDSEFVQGRQFVLEATARIFGVPLSLLGLSQTATYASQREFHKQLYTDVLPSWFELIQSELELQFLPLFAQTSDLYAEFLVEAKMRGDFLDQAEMFSKMIGRPWMTAREGRDKYNLGDRGIASDDELVVPVGPNFALESMPASAVALPPAAAKMARDLQAFFDRQGRSVLSAKGAGQGFDHDRWNRELAPILGRNGDGARIAERINLNTAMELADSTRPTEVFERARTELALALAAELQEVPT